MNDLEDFMPSYKFNIGRYILIDMYIIIEYKHVTFLRLGIRCKYFL